MQDISFDEIDSFEVYLTQYIHDEDNNDTAIVWTYEFLDSAISYDGFPEFSSFIGPVIPVQHMTLQSGHQFQSKLKTVGAGMSAKSSINALADSIPPPIQINLLLFLKLYFITDSIKGLICL